MGAGRNSSGFYFALCAVAAKLAMDFFIPYRDANFLAFNLLLVLLFLAFRPRIYLGRGGRMMFGIVMLILLAQVARAPDNPISFKLATLPCVAVLFYSIGRSLTESAVKKLFSVLLVLFVLAFLGNYALSVASGLLFSREFWNFEHPNLLGSYILVVALPAHYLILRESRVRGWAIGSVIVIAAFLSTSTGALLLSIGIFIRLRGLRARHVVTSVLIGLVLVGVGIAMLSLFNPVTYEKIVGPFRLVGDGSWSRLVAEARSGGGITWLASGQQGSFTWRIYAYLVYLFYVLQQGSMALLFGNGVSGYTAVWNGAMPHNDFILLLVDFGLLVLVLCLVCLLVLARKVWRGNPEWFVMLAVIVLRLMYENNIYSYYLASAGCLFISLIVGVQARAKRSFKPAAPSPADAA